MNAQLVNADYRRHIDSTFDTTTIVTIVLKCYYAIQNRKDSNDIVESLLC